MAKRKTKRKNADNGLQKRSRNSFGKKDPIVELRFFNPLPGCSESEKNAWSSGEDLLDRSGD